MSIWGLENDPLTYNGQCSAPHWGRDKMANILLITFSSVFSCLKIAVIFFYYNSTKVCYIVLTSACQSAILLDKHLLTYNYVALFYIMRWHINSYITHCRLGMDMICRSMENYSIFKILSSSIRFSCITNKKTLFGIILSYTFLMGISYTFIYTFILKVPCISALWHSLHTECCLFYINYGCECSIILSTLLCIFLPSFLFGWISLKVTEVQNLWLRYMPAGDRSGHSQSQTSSYARDVTLQLYLCLPPCYLKEFSKPTFGSRPIRMHVSKFMSSNGNWT